MNLFKLITKKSIYKNEFLKSDSFAYLKRNFFNLVKFRSIFKFHFLLNEYDLILANLLLKSYSNKIKIEKKIANILISLDPINKGSDESIAAHLKDEVNTLPKFVFRDIDIFILFFNVENNEYYFNTPSDIYAVSNNNLRVKFKDKLINPFAIYGVSILDSLFSPLVKIDHYKEIYAFYHYDFRTLLFVNTYGKLLDRIVLFDKYMDNINENDISHRLLPAVKAYFEDNKTGVVDALLENGFISKELFDELKGIKR